MAGPEPLDFDVRCFLVAHATGIVLIDAGMPGSHDAVHAGLERIGAGWDDVTDIVLTHGHPDHVGGLAEVMASTRAATVWAGAGDQPAIQADAELRDLVDGETVRDLRVLHTPGHTPGHCCFVLDDAVLFAGDLIGSVAGSLSRGPAAFTADAEQAEQTLKRVAALEFERVLFGHGDEIPDPVGQLRSLVGRPESAPSDR